jgi:hypothetical protein
MVPSRLHMSGRFSRGVDNFRDNDLGDAIRFCMARRLIVLKIDAYLARNRLSGGLRRLLPEVGVHSPGEGGDGDDQAAQRDWIGVLVGPSVRLPRVKCGIDGSRKARAVVRVQALRSRTRDDSDWVGHSLSPFPLRVLGRSVVIARFGEHLEELECQGYAWPVTQVSHDKPIDPRGMGGSCRLRGDIWGRMTAASRSRRLGARRSLQHLGEASKPDPVAEAGA